MSNVEAALREVDERTPTATGAATAAATAAEAEALDPKEDEEDEELDDETKEESGKNARVYLLKKWTRLRISPIYLCVFEYGKERLCLNLTVD